MTVSSPQLIGASVLVGLTMALLWLHVPLIPAIVGAGGAGLLLYRRAHRQKH